MKAEGLGDAERSLALTYAPASARPAVRALFALDDALSGVLRTAAEPMIAQMRFTWWHAELSALDRTSPPSVPVLRDLAEHVVERGVTGEALARQVEGWEALFEDPALGEAAMLAHARLRGGGLFAAVAACSGYAGDGVEAAGQGWALADLAAHVREPHQRDAAFALARPLLDVATCQRWGRGGRTLGALAHLARIDASAATPSAPGSPRRVARMAWHALTGR
ncbi:squalene/phytoene synthase family protein [Sphingomonas japonica]|uniref:Phytoene synthase n=1 Tax=Sphingomonas japonica TaxID=511662 RepID=A0ABX0U234_9SPHN|nr:squalene/phytoene synthase family protein [Sphingomonas japonica]NIJ24564.1 phytoene synthase [Sphingomonas japonica]